ncbi:tail fiber protein [Salmonella enterica]|uniref:tail fiber protein n=1 Tax=Salmonella enterica TaxID=28901 RepID=UPI003D321DBB
MGKLTELEQWDEDVYQIETSDPVLGGPEGLSNRPQKQLANRTQWLKKQLEDANNALAEHAKSRNHPDATLTDKGFVKLYSGVASIDEAMAATPKAVKIAMDNASARLAKERNLADLPNIPLALSNLTLADVKKAVEQTHLGLSELPKFFPATEDDLTSLPAGYMALSKNATPGGPLPDENWHYLEVAGKLNGSSNNPSRKGAVIRLTQIGNPRISWTGVKFDDGSTTTAKFTWARDFNSLNKPTPEDVGLAATKKAIDDTQTGLAVQGVMWISTADDLSNLPSGAHRFARNNTGVTVLPSDGYFFLEVLAKRDVANGSCILATSDTRDVWIGFRYAVPDEANFTWTQLNQNVENLGLTETVKLAAGAVPLNKDGSVDSIKTLKVSGNIFANQLFLTDSLSAVGTDTEFNVMFHARDAGGNTRWAYGPYINGWDIHSYSPDGAWRANPLHVDYNTSEVSVSCNFHVGGARIAIDGNIWGTRWKAGGAWLWDAIAEQLTARDNNINARATVDWVRQNFLSGFRLGGVESAQVWRAYGYNDTPPYVITGVINGNTDDLIDNITRRPLQMYINGWRNVDWL